MEFKTEEIPVPNDTAEKGRSFMDRIPDVDDGMDSMSRGSIKNYYIISLKTPTAINN